MKVLVAVTIACVFTVTYATLGQMCTDVSQCGTGECCQILSEFMVVSKRELLPFKQPIQKSGTCQKYKMEGEHCNSFDKMNGYCSCAPGLTCHTYQVPIPTLQPVMTMAPTVATHMISPARRSIVAPQDGYQWVSRCEKITT
ncbi:hypothetical protein EGW08_022989 [Elysia chlorotica]|uniref:Prokineticin domain-containing protein n=1 Tax=Elysia chlorotica TaxID=188477 RepID=A0A3S0Z2D5_ELYCH|nr:hypothetical protein EGW08_022989 [Elysia chlorotica]